ncbi:MAG: carboxylesterase family protein, partial [Oscillospiraceae bacterium]|nr:carboxylesterase family protein [Oscillospiraceae bacterium]
MPKNFISNYEYPVVSTPKGLIRGYFYDGVFNFKGIKYANAKRFHKPEPIEPWEGIKNALSWGFNCPTMTEDSRDETAYLDHRYWPKNENCQYLNVWTTTIDSTAKKPVILWIHGGGFAGCSAIELLCADGEEMCGYGDVVMVSLNHRLNILGFLDVSAYGPQYENSGNAGLAELIPNLLTSLGILGTFMGLSRGLSSLNFADSARLISGIPDLLSGMRFAFGTSVAGISC